MSGLVPVPCPSCGDFIIWAQTPAAVSKAVNAVPVPEGTLMLVRREDMPPLVRNVAKAHRFGRNWFLSHDSTCRHAPKSRTRDEYRVGVWLLAGALGDRPYPCLCHRQGWGCRAGARSDRCPCWARSDNLDHLPRACCAVTAAGQQSRLEH